MASQPKLLTEHLRTACEITNCGIGTRLLQIGASDGSSADPVLPLIRTNPRWAFFLVEPRRALFDELARRHIKRENVIVHQAAIIPPADEEGIVSMYEYAEDEALPRWVRHVASIDQSIVQQHNTQRAEDHDQPLGTIVEVSAIGQHFDTAMQQMCCNSPDVVVCNMMGSEYLVVEAVLPHNPRVICYNHNFMPQPLRKSVAKSLADAGYTRHFTGRAEQVWLRA